MRKEIILTQECNQEIRAISDTMEVLSGKWKIQIVATLIIHGKMRFMELMKTTNGIAAKKLSKDLEELEINKIITRTVISTKPITVEYEITPYGRKTEHLINIITEWGMTHREFMFKDKN